MKKEGKIPTLLGLLFLVIGIATGVVLIGQRQLFSLRATPETSPRDVRVTNITDTSFSVSWSTSLETQGAVLFGTSESTSDTAPEDGPGTGHHVDLKGLKSGTLYYFKILSGGTTHERAGKPWSQKTGPTLPLPSSDLISGTVKTSSGQPAERALVYINATGGSALSGLTNTAGFFSLNIANTRTTSLTSFLSYNDKTVLSVFVKPEEGEVASSQVTIGNARPIPPLILGQTQDLRKTQSSGTGELTSPKSNIEIKTPSPTPKGTSGFKSDLEFVSSPSAQTGTPSPSPKSLGGTTPTPSPTPTPTPTAKPTGQPTVAPTATPKTSLPATDSGVPVAGDLTMTFLLFILGIGSIFSGIVIFKKA